VVVVVERDEIDAALDPTLMERRSPVGDREIVKGHGFREAVACQHAAKSVEREIYMFAGVFGGRGAGAGSISAEAYAGMAILAAGAGLATMLGSAIGWTAIGKRTAG
jgi:hypothetical protein